MVTADSKHDLPIEPNLLANIFTAEEPSQAWTTNIAYIAKDEGWLYLMVFLDLYGRSMVGGA